MDQAMILEAQELIKRLDNVYCPGCSTAPIIEDNLKFLRKLLSETDSECSHGVDDGACKECYAEQAEADETQSQQPFINGTSIGDTLPKQEFNLSASVPTLLSVNNENGPVLTINFDGTVQVHQEGGDKEAAHLFYSSLQQNGVALFKRLDELERQLQLKVEFHIPGAVWPIPSQYAKVISVKDVRRRLYEALARNIMFHTSSVHGLDATLSARLKPDTYFPDYKYQNADIHFGWLVFQRMCDLVEPSIYTEVDNKGRGAQ